MSVLKIARNLMFPAALAVAAVAAGCQDNKKPETARGVTDLAPPAVPSSIAPVTPVASSTATPTGAMTTATPSTYSTPAYSAPTPAYNGSAPAANYASPAPGAEPTLANTSTAAAGGTYTVRSGDTLWKIAARAYGDGKQYKKILNANPGLDPAKLRAGQTITLP